ncbi:hypothetical protein NDU88_005152 [Pleurodeles waltl]|uniref:Uncharacterized protein n=1 Tax=Pleurodeles waltl TaxID=8319 RepID=A0AAV7MG19_PLEWA|nr:hypothetical protein NDU88_005152 [Pleurodeles waltl]
MTTFCVVPIYCPIHCSAGLQRLVSKLVEWFTVLMAAEDKVWQAMRLLEEVGRLDLLTVGALKHGPQGVLRQRWQRPCLHVHCQRPGDNDQRQEGLMGTWCSLRSLRGREGPWASSWTNVEHEQVVAARGSVSLDLRREGRFRATSDVLGHQSGSSLAAGWERGHFTALSALWQPQGGSTQDSTEEQAGPSGLATVEMRGHTVLDYDEKSLEEREVQDEDGMHDREEA